MRIKDYLIVVCFVSICNLNNSFEKLPKSHTSQ